MSFRSKRSKLTQVSRGKDTTSETLQDVVSQVIRDVSAIGDQGEDTPQGKNPDVAHTETTQPSQATATVVGLLAGDNRSNKRNAGKKQSVTPSLSQPLVNDSQLPKASNRWSFRSQRNDDQPNQDGQAEETEIGSAGNVWTSDPLMTEPVQVTSNGRNDVRRNQKGSVGRPSLTPPPSLTFHAESLDQPSRLQRLQNRVHENDGKLSLHGLSEPRQQNPSEWDNDLELDDDEEEEEEEIYRQPGQHGFSQSRGSNISEWSNDIQFDDMEEVEMRDSEGKRGKKGGSIGPRHVWSLRPGVRFVVPFNSLDQPVRKGGHVLIRFLGDLAKNCELCPVGEANWRRVDKNCKVNIISLLREKFVLPDRPEIDKCILRHLGNKWKNYKHDLKLQYKKPDKTQEEIASTVPKGIPPSQWVKLVQYWFSDKCKMLSTKGKAARAAQTHLHVTGSKSYARRRDEFEKTHGREPGALEWFLETHQRKDGTFVENTSKEFADTAAALIAQRGSTSSHRTTAVENQVFNELMYSDEYQRPLGYGFGVTGNKVFRTEAESRKRGYGELGIKAEFGSSKKKMFRMGSERKNSGYFPPDSSAEVERLNFAVTALGETNQLMQGQIKMQSRQLQMQSQQLQMQSKQIEGVQVQLQQVTSLLTKYGAMLNNPQAHHTPKPAIFPGFNGANRQDASSEYSDEESDSTDWDSDS
ncbi:uncharacterized protein LOC141648349 isoform X2 [Silene latifolia]|uniref:uncharacterized protein LOC141648349 isoform X2 n=1 Tax=Silene latifolia TaxID=37657 RepID=UPI003D78AFA4